ncbi:MAG: biopolymer transporter ExbD [Acidobacteriota bacterium]|nr:biopolymer transporter ExbD [Acidobacteriota bacterium]
MAINLGSGGGDGEVMVDINTTPLIDVMLVLLIMLIITVPVQTHAVKLDMPQVNSPPPIVKPQVVDLVIDFDGTMTWNGTLLPNRSALEEDLRSVAQQNPQSEIHLAPNKLVKYSYVAMVLAEAQRLGVVKIGLVGNEQFSE